MRKYIDIIKETDNDLDKSVLQIIAILEFFEVDKRSFELGEHGLIVNDNVHVRGSYDKLPLVFDEVTGNFIISDVGLKTFENCPEVVWGDFFCRGNQDLKSLKGMPRRVTGAVHITNTGIESLEHSPEKIGFSYNLSNNSNLRTLKGITKKLASLNVTNCPNLKPWEMRYALFCDFTATQNCIFSDYHEVNDVFDEFFSLGANSYEQRFNVRQDKLPNALERLKKIS